MEQRFLRIMEKEIDLEQSPVIARGPQDDAALERDWEHQNGVWSVTDGWICGKHIGNSGGHPVLQKALSRERPPGV